MPNSDLIRGGTASIANGQTVVTGQSVSWSNVLEGDFFGAHVGLAVPILSVAGSTITLTYPWPGPTQVAAAYAIQPKGDVTRFQDRVRVLLEQLTDGDLAAIASLTSDADKLAYYTGAGAAALTNLTAIARAALAANNPSEIASLTSSVQQGGGAGQLNNKLRFGWTAANRLNAQVDGSDQGSIWTDVLSTGNNNWTKLPNGLILQRYNPVISLSAFGTGISTLPTAFSSASSYIAMICNGDASLNFSYQFLASNGYPSASQIAFQAVKPDGSYQNGGNVRLNIFAIGT